MQTAEGADLHMAKGCNRMDHDEPYSIPDNDEAPAETPSQPQIPWEQRKEIGRIRAYWRTAKMVMTSPGDLEQFLDSPVCEKHAKKFRRVTFQLTVIITLGIHIVWLLKAFGLADQAGYSLREVESFEAIVLARMAFSVLSLIALFLATRSLEWFSSPRDFDPVGQDRAIALSCYSCGPVLIVTIAGGIASLIAILTWSEPDIQPVMRVVNLAWLAVFLVWWPTAVRAIHFTTGQNARRTTIAAIALPLIWTGQQLLVAIIPISVVQWFLMASSLS